MKIEGHHLPPPTVPLGHYPPSPRTPPPSPNPGKPPSISRLASRFFLIANEQSYRKRKIANQTMGTRSNTWIPNTSILSINNQRLNSFLVHMTETCYRLDWKEKWKQWGGFVFTFSIYVTSRKNEKHIRNEHLIKHKKYPSYWKWIKYNQDTSVLIYLLHSCKKHIGK